MKREEQIAQAAQKYAAKTSAGGYFDRELLAECFSDGAVWADLHEQTFERKTKGSEKLNRGDLVLVRDVFTKTWEIGRYVGLRMTSKEGVVVYEATTNGLFNSNFYECVPFSGNESMLFTNKKIRKK